LQYTFEQKIRLNTNFRHYQKNHHCTKKGQHFTVALPLKDDNQGFQSLTITKKSLVIYPAQMVEVQARYITLLMP